MRLFGTDGVRGRANSYPMDAGTALAIGRAAAEFFRSKGCNSHIVIGQDTRISGDMIAHAVAAGINSTGTNVMLVGVLPTPGIAHIASLTGAAAGVVISASHNPFQDNGIKVFDGDGFKLGNQAQHEIERLLSHARKSDDAGTEITGRIELHPDACADYITFLQQSVPHLNLNGLSVVLDCANGANFQCAPQLFVLKGAQVHKLSCEPNGMNINHRCGSQHPENLVKAVVVQKADMGLAFDGDGDRLIAVAENGSVLTGDQIMAICAKDMQTKGLLKNRKIVSTVMSNLGFHQALKEMGIQLHTTQVGDRHVMEKMVEEDAVLGGEDSGHMIFRDIHTTGDGIIAALKLIDAVLTARRPLSQLATIMTVYPQIMINVDVLEKPDLNSIPEIVKAIESAEAQLGDQGRVLVRYSGTQNKCRVMVEGPTERLTQTLCREIAQTVQGAIGNRAII